MRFWSDDVDPLFRSLVDAKRATLQWLLAGQGGGIASRTLDSLDIHLLRDMARERVIPSTKANIEALRSLQSETADRVIDDTRRPRMPVEVYQSVQDLVMSCLTMSNNFKGLEKWVETEWRGLADDTQVTQAQHAIHWLQTHDFSGSFALGRVYAVLWDECHKRGFQRERAREKIAQASRRAAKVVAACVV